MEVPARVAVLLLICLSGSCATREAAQSLQGSTAQRLVTYSLEKFVVDLVDQPEMQSLSGSPVHLRVIFLQDHPMVDYATQLIKRQMEATRNTSFVTTPSETEFELDVFFNSIGTDRDSFGLSVPTFGLSSTPDARIDLLAIDMFHGLAEGYAVIRRTDTGKIDKTRRLLARVRADNVATPVADFPINHLD